MSQSDRVHHGASIPTLRNWILLALLVGTSIYTGIMFALAHSLSDRFGPEVRRDLEWRVERGAVELAKACELAVAIGEAAELTRCFGPYASSKDVQSLVVADAEGNVLARHGDPGEEVAQLFSGQPHQVRSGAGHLVTWAPVQIEGAELGKLAVVVSTGRLEEAQSLLSRASAATIVGGLAGLVFGALVVIFFARAVAERDSRLFEYASGLEQMVEARTQELHARNAGMRLVLDNVAQGFVTIDYEGVMSSERSAIVDQWFGQPEPGMKLEDYLDRVSPGTGLWMNIALEQLRDDLMPAELILDQMPNRVAIESATFSLAYRPVEGEVPRLLVIVSDVTEAMARERAEREQRELLALFQRISVDRNGVEEFVREAAGLVQALRVESDPVLQRRLVHTLKGNCSLYGLETYAVLAHEIESEMIENESPLTATQRDRLVEVWKDAMVRVGQLLGNEREDIIEVHAAELKEAVDCIRGGGDARALEKVFASWQDELASRRLQRLGQQAAAVARRLRKPDPKVVIEDHGIRLRAASWSAVFTSLVHVVRNAMDHGIESVAERLEASKPEAGTLTLRASRSGSQVTLEIADDGAGVDFERIAEKARAAGLPAETRADMIEALFSDGLSTKEAANDISGRGVGMAAVRQVVLQAGGSLDVVSERGAGTRFVFVLDETRLESADERPSLISASLVPSSVKLGLM